MRDKIFEGCRAAEDGRHIQSLDGGLQRFPGGFILVAVPTAIGNGQIGEGVIQRLLPSTHARLDVPESVGCTLVGAAIEEIGAVPPGAHCRFRPGIILLPGMGGAVGGYELLEWTFARAEGGVEELELGGVMEVRE